MSASLHDTEKHARAKASCQQSGNEPNHHFAGAGKMIELGKGGMRDVPDPAAAMKQAGAEAVTALDGNPMDVVVHLFSRKGVR
jgi:hypothetical protein